MRLVIIGSGNIATFFAHKFQLAGMQIVQIISAHLQHAKELADHFNASYSDTIKDLQTDADIYLFAVSDDVLLEFAGHLQLRRQFAPVDIIAHYPNNCDLSRFESRKIGHHIGRTARRIVMFFDGFRL